MLFEIWRGLTEARLFGGLTWIVGKTMREATTSGIGSLSVAINGTSIKTDTTTACRTNDVEKVVIALPSEGFRPDDSSKEDVISLDMVSALLSSERN